MLRAPNRFHRIDIEFLMSSVRLIDLTTFCKRELIELEDNKII